MGLDVRTPLGLTFAITGLTLLIYGMATYGSAMYASSLGINLNLIWGGVMLCFGLVTALLGRAKRVAAKRSNQFHQ